MGQYYETICGNVKIYQEHIDRFLEVAQRFKLEGLQVNNRQDKSPEEITQQLKKAEDQKPLGGKNPPSQKSNNRQQGGLGIQCFRIQQF